MLPYSDPILPPPHYSTAKSISPRACWWNTNVRANVQVGVQSNGIEQYRQGSQEVTFWVKNSLRWRREDLEARLIVNQVAEKMKEDKERHFIKTRDSKKNIYRDHRTQHAPWMGPLRESHAQGFETRSSSSNPLKLWFDGYREAVAIRFLWDLPPRCMGGKLATILG